MDSQGNLERTWKVREKSGNLKIKGYGRQSSENLLIVSMRGKDVHSHELVSANLTQTPKIEVIQLTPLK